jgi:hypothetical protein
MFRPIHHWGRHLWAFIHTITIIDYEQPPLGPGNKIYAIKIVENLKGLLYTIPCDHCKKMYKEELQILDTLDLNESNALFKWSVDLHNKVNQKLNKEIITYEKALEIWSYSFQ